MGDAGRYGLAIIGGVAGAVFLGNPFLGFAIGSALGTALFPAELPGQSVEGPRLGDLRVQTSSYGRGIPIFEGEAVRVAGNLIWSTAVQETRQVSTQDSGAGKGGGPSQEVTQTSYTYAVSCAVALGEGEIGGVRKIWANGELVYNIDSAADFETYIVSQAEARAIRVYAGTETQDPDPLISALEADVPGYRGIAYVVFDDLQLARFGNRVPAFEFEVVLTGTDTAAVGYLDAQDQFGSLAAAVAITQDGNLLGWWETGASTRRLALLNPYTLQIIREYRPYDLAASVYPQLVPPAMNSQGDLMFIANSDRTWIWPAGGTPTAVTTGQDCRIWVDENGDFLYCGLDSALPAGTQSRLWRIRAGTATPETIAVLPNSARDLALDWDGYAYVTYSLASVGHILKIRLSDGVVVADRAAAAYNLIFSLHPAGDGSVWFTLGSGGSGDFELWRLPADFVTTATKIYDHNGTFTGQGEVRIARDWLTGDILVAFPAHYQRYAAAGTLIEDYGSTVRGFGVSTDPRYPSSVYVYNPVSPSGGVNRFVSAERAHSLTSNVVTLADAITDICGRVDLAPADIDVSGLTREVRGYVVANRMRASEALMPLLTAYLVDAVESGNVIKFVERGAASVATIPEADMGAFLIDETPPDPHSEGRIPEPVLPREIAVNYLDPDSDYQPVTQYARRLVGRGVNDQSINLPMALTADDARRAAETMLYEAWIARRTHELPLSAKYTRLEPGDAVDLQLPEDTITARIVQKDEGQGLLRLQLVGYDATIYAQTLTGAAAPGGQDSLAALVPANLLLLDTALLREQDDTYGFYAVAGGLSGAARWPGGKLFKSTDNVDYTDTGQAWLAATVIGYAATRLGDFGGGLIFDEGAATVTVSLVSGALASTTQDNVLNGANAAYLGGEIIQFTTATLVGAQTYTLSGLLRGRLGTEWAMRRHKIGEPFVLLSTDTTRRVDTPSGDLAAARWYKSVTFGTQVAAAAAQPFTLAGNCLKPLAPVFIRGGRNAALDVNIDWYRRARKNANWNDYIDVPLDEDAEAYEVDVFAGATKTITAISQAPDGVITSTAHGYSAGNVIFITGVNGMSPMNERAFTIATVPTANTYTVGEDTGGYPAYTSGGTSRLRGRTITASIPGISYTAAQQTTDYGGTQAPVYSAHYQMSSRVGRGYAGIAVT